MLPIVGMVDQLIPLLWQFAHFTCNAACQFATLFFGWQITRITVQNYERNSKKCGKPILIKKCVIKNMNSIANGVYDGLACAFIVLAWKVFKLRDFLCAYFPCHWHRTQVAHWQHIACHSIDYFQRLAVCLPVDVGMPCDRPRNWINVKKIKKNNEN